MYEIIKEEEKKLISRFSKNKGGKIFQMKKAFHKNLSPSLPARGWCWFPSPWWCEGFLRRSSSLSLAMEMSNKPVGGRSKLNSLSTILCRSNLSLISLQAWTMLTSWRRARRHRAASGPKGLIRTFTFNKTMSNGRKLSHPTMINHHRISTQLFLESWDIEQVAGRQRVPSDLDLVLPAWQFNWCKAKVPMFLSFFTAHCFSTWTCFLKSSLSLIMLDILDWSDFKWRILEFVDFKFENKNRDLWKVGCRVAQSWCLPFIRPNKWGKTVFVFLCLSWS